MKEVHLHLETGKCLRQPGHLAGREGGDVSVHTNDGRVRRDQPFGGPSDRPSGGQCRPFPQEIVERLGAALGNEALGDHQAGTELGGEPGPRDQAAVPGMRRGDPRHPAGSGRD